MGLFGTVGVATPASAASSDCPVGYACAWEGTDYASAGVGTRLIKFFYCQKNFSWVDYAGTSISADNSATSVSNRGQHETARFYSNYDYIGGSFPLYENEGDGNLGNGTGNVKELGYNNTISSAKYAGSPQDCV